MLAVLRVNVRTSIILAVLTLVLIATYLSTPSSYDHLGSIHPFGASKPNHDSKVSFSTTSSTLSMTTTSAAHKQPEPSSELPSELPSEPPSEPPSGIKYKNDTLRPLAARPFIRINETFFAAAGAQFPSDLPSVPYWNRPPIPHVKEVTPIFVGFTRNWLLLQQTVVSLITAGWPPSDIYVVENTGVMDANQKGQLSLQNPFYLDHYRLTKIFQVNVLVTPSLQTFSQLQNFYLFHAINNKWPQYFWAHMDIIVQSSEDRTPYKSFYEKAVDSLRNSGKKWALKYFAYDWVTLMNTEVMELLGGWDTMISYYTIDCDMYDRMRMNGFSTDANDCGPVYDTGESLDDLSVLYREGDELNSTTYHDLRAAFKTMAKQKNNGALGPRNRWQVAQMGGQGDPYYRDLDGFAEALEYQVQAGIQVYTAKWHAKGCGLRDSGLKAEDEWKIESID